jgi:hypothetical protein
MPLSQPLCFYHERCNGSRADTSLPFELDPVGERLTDTASLQQPVGAAQWVVDAPVEAGQSRLLYRCFKGAEGTWF